MVKSGSAHRDKPEGKTALGKPMHRWEVNEMDLRGIGFGGVKWTGSGQGLMVASCEHCNGRWGFS
jgi:hypothetical protein